MTLKRMGAAGALAAFTGCMWSNPYDTARDRDGADAQEQVILDLAVRANDPYEGPSTPLPEVLPPGISAWKAAVLDDADAATRKTLETSCLERETSLRVEELALAGRPSRVYSEELDRVRRDLWKEQLKLRLIRQAGELSER